jgi:hypothetical protein
MRASKLSREFKAVQRESTQVAAELRKALFSGRLVESPSPEQGGFVKPPCASNSPYVLISTLRVKNGAQSG